VGWFRRRRLGAGQVLYGAAYKVLYERLDPDGCVDDARHSVLLIEADGVLKWAASQSLGVREAYRRAAKAIVTRAETTLENNRRARQMTAAMQTLPRPPASLEPESTEARSEVSGKVRLVD
jgi:hypothetical protein